MQLWSLFTQATEFNCRPSELVGISQEDAYAAFCFDEAVFMWGRFVDGELKKAQQGAKNDKQARSKVEMRFRALMREEEAEDVNGEHDNFPKHLERKPAPSQFRDPSTALKK